MPKFHLSIHQWRTLILLPVLLLVSSPSVFGQVEKVYTTPFACAVSDARQRPTYLAWLRSSLATVDEAIAAPISPERLRFLTLVRKFDPNFASLGKEFINAVLLAYMRGTLTRDEAVWVLVHYKRTYVLLVDEDSALKVRAEELSGVRYSIATCVQFHERKLAEEQASSPPPDRVGPSARQGFRADGSCHTEYLGYTAGNGKYYPPADPADSKGSVSVAWDNDHSVYVIRWGSQRIVASSLSASFNDGCNANPDTADPWVPGCIYSSRPNLKYRDGRFSAEGDTVTLSVRGEDGNAGRYNYVNYVNTCTFRRR
jgi:hypothetical protein